MQRRETLGANRQPNLTWRRRGSALFDLSFHAMHRREEGCSQRQRVSPKPCLSASGARMRPGPAYWGLWLEQCVMTGVLMRHVWTANGLERRACPHCTREQHRAGLFDSVYARSAIATINSNWNERCMRVLLPCAGSCVRLDWWRRVKCEVGLSPFVIRYLLWCDGIYQLSVFAGIQAGIEFAQVFSSVRVTSQPSLRAYPRTQDSSVRRLRASVSRGSWGHYLYAIITQKKLILTAMPVWGTYADICSCLYQLNKEAKTTNIKCSYNTEL